MLSEFLLSISVYIDVANLRIAWVGNGLNLGFNDFAIGKSLILIEFLYYTKLNNKNYHLENGHKSLIPVTATGTLGTVGEKVTQNGIKVIYFC